ncbi:Hypothetical predicted protein [Lecanosticta acicola]|uniref:Methyltransferase domain-containing protein n=1 Tax=Lecanosticta acicola TaxID=111012 RepID=A0AAI9EG45_9PEZI|nr:Hypothetical predicted protein [Lecanosticta acicola]
MESLASAARAYPLLHPRRPPSSASSSSDTATIKAIFRTMSEQQEFDLLSNPFELRYGRRYLRELPYPLPCDLAEIQRQNLRTLLTTTVFGKPLCNPRWETEPPRRVLEMGCGGGYWSGVAHDWFLERGHRNVEFVGLDIAPIASDLKATGVNWRFVHQDMRRLPLPFEDDYFDLVMMKDITLTMPLDRTSDKVLEDVVRILAPGGAIELWDSDNVIRSLAPGAPPAPSRKPEEQEIAERTATYAIAPGHAFVPTRNKHLEKANAWIAEALDRRKLNPTPCARVGEGIVMEPNLEGIGMRRVAVPFGELRWEQTAARHSRPDSNGHDSPMSTGSGEKASRAQKVLTSDQLALRQTALMTVLQQIESFEPMMREVSKKNAEEWSLWRANMLAELMDPKTALTGECLELGAWWATKKQPCDEI